MARRIWLYIIILTISIQAFRDEKQFCELYKYFRTEYLPVTLTVTQPKFLPAFILLGAAGTIEPSLKQALQETKSNAAIAKKRFDAKYPKVKNPMGGDSDFVTSKMESGFSSLIVFLESLENSDAARVDSSFKQFLYSIEMTKTYFSKENLSVYNGFACMEMERDQFQNKSLVLEEKLGFKNIKLNRKVKDMQLQEKDENDTTYWKTHTVTSDLEDASANLGEVAGVPIHNIQVKTLDDTIGLISVFFNGTKEELITLAKSVISTYGKPVGDIITENCFCPGFKIYSNNILLEFGREVDGGPAVLNYYYLPMRNKYLKMVENKAQANRESQTSKRKQEKELIKKSASEF